MIRVAHVTTGGRMGGAERLIIDVLSAGRELSLWEASVFVLGPGDELAHELRSRGIGVYALGARGAIGLLVAQARLALALARRRPDVVHGHLLHGSALGLLAARAVGVACPVMTRHYERYVWMYGSRLDRILHRIGNRLARHIFAISNASSDVLVRTEKVDPARVSVVHNGIDAGRVREAAGAAPPRSARVTIGSVGSLHPRKGHDDLIRAVSRMRARDLVRLVLVGDGPALDDLRRLAGECGLEDAVEMPGHSPRPYPLMRSFDIYAQPSREEGFGISVLEAMALGLPVVATAVGGLPEIISSAAVGLLVPGGDIGALAAALDRLVADEGLRESLGSAASRHVDTKFDARATAASYAARYRDLLTPRG